QNFRRGVLGVAPRRGIALPDRPSGGRQPTGRAERTVRRGGGTLGAAPPAGPDLAPGGRTGRGGLAGLPGAREAAPAAVRGGLDDAVLAVAGSSSAAGPARTRGSRPLHVGTALSPIPFTPPVPSFTQFVNSPITRPGVLRSEPSHHSPRLRGRRGV